MWKLAISNLMKETQSIVSYLYQVPFHIFYQNLNCTQTNQTEKYFETIEYLHHDSLLVWFQTKLYFFPSFFKVHWFEKWAALFSIPPQTQWDLCIFLWNFETIQKKNLAKEARKKRHKKDDRCFLHKTQENNFLSTSKMTHRISTKKGKSSKNNIE